MGLLKGTPSLQQAAGPGAGAALKQGTEKTPVKPILWFEPLLVDIDT